MLLVLFNCLYFHMVLWHTYFPYMQNKLCNKIMSTCDFFISACIIIPPPPPIFIPLKKKPYQHIFLILNYQVEEIKKMKHE